MSEFWGRGQDPDRPTMGEMTLDELYGDGPEFDDLMHWYLDALSPMGIYYFFQHPTADNMLKASAVPVLASTSVWAVSLLFETEAERRAVPFFVKRVGFAIELGNMQMNVAKSIGRNTALGLWRFRGALGFAALLGTVAHTFNPHSDQSLLNAAADLIFYSIWPGFSDWTFMEP